MVRSVPESEWDEQQQTWMLALLLYERLRCQTCGQDLRDTTTHERWDVPPPVECNACTAITAKQKQYAHDYPEQLSSFRWTAIKRG